MMLLAEQSLTKLRADGCSEMFRVQVTAEAITTM